MDEAKKRIVDLTKQGKKEKALAAIEGAYVVLDAEAERIGGLEDAAYGSGLSGRPPLNDSHAQALEHQRKLTLLFEKASAIKEVW